MTPLQNTVILDISRINGSLVEAARSDNLGRFYAELTALERLARDAREQLHKHVVLDLEDVEDDDL